MKIVVIYGTEHRGSTYNISQLFLEKLRSKPEEVVEFFLPKDMPYFCVGCAKCFTVSEKLCPHYSRINPIKEAMEKADLMILTSPVYVFHASGQMKAFLDHFGFQWMVHRPNKTMFSKMALIISTAAGGGMKSTNKDIKDSMNFWGVGKIFTYGKAVAAINWEGVSEKKKIEINRDVERIAAKILSRFGNIKPSLKVKKLFYIMRLVQKRFTINAVDKEYWESQGWLGHKRPWKRL
ncbi:NADPH-dependent FMN reductase [Clostridium pasteurianum DSM 525 = ATCC 6013]|uniref:NADPH-dependent FMN reductase n=1 Tax=Clostridium pasteurianum DSM 525 = ATCC 6013 TaxID=1262449 RepID=A0A0H3J1S0_CLOPA|nr:NAD(P)H-dependent oxidoreductase [Clostridium pasteurianum]AJA47359.1 NADPH-dependent FMN reductase [Clostridium pasteurianum DSM 525 = ATCC 6013]AJA51347.1 NADPH-dependent FMN reductase [Clostridium pasteurianum DSM 525 = ATCC 6013]AOZ74692.1 flavin reductase [Clostridium pasteurianum DSM 525 = ATCC 6013]AOZ78488.1 flavin reductase [Clostridium pasteurianum]ELP58697.1 Multimeric flavodoxin WrbA [Clostridium pasteurianum DSM 525 = ATCC 6013]